MKQEHVAEPTSARFLVGIDLGTTNCALAYVDSRIGDARVRDFAVPQVIAPSENGTLPVLPSFSYEPVPDEFPPGALASPAVPGGEHVVGVFARRHGAQTPGRLISSAKSWLSHPGVDRTAALLPWHGAPDVTRISPVEASARYLAHLRAAWDAAFPEHPLAEQEVAITVPASFDEVARELTLRAAEKAGIPNVTLIEEPQAAFYAWMASQGERAETGVRPGQLTLICDVGGGTSDFTLIEARPADRGRVRFHRVSVGDHLILGGDNMDLALAHHVEARLAGGARLDPRRWGLLVQACRSAKEALLGPNPPERLTLSVAGGARLIGGALQAEVTREEVHSLLLDGFFPRIPLGERPSAARSGFQEFGLPYAADAAVTRHLSWFLARHSRAAEGRSGSADGAGASLFPDQVLFNGGVFESAILQERLLGILNEWRGQAGAEGAVQILPNQRLDLAVARGAAYAVWLRRQPERRIAAGLSRAYYVQVGDAASEGPPRAVCLAPAGLDEGKTVVLPQQFTLRIRQPVEFALFTSSTRLHDETGTIVDVDPEQLSALPPVRTVVSSGRSSKAATATVQIHSRLTEIGTLDVRCVEAGSGNRSWKLEFDVRGNARRGQRAAPGIGSGTGESMEMSVLEACARRIRSVFAPTDPTTGDPAGLIRGLEQDAGARRDAWTLPFLRALWEEAIAVEAGRRRSVLHEARWLNLVGFSLRPGYGYTVDDWRVQQTWKLFFVGTVFPRNEMCRAEWCILWRRIAGGLSAGHQRALAEPFASVFRGRKGQRGPHETAEIWRLLGGLELLPLSFKLEIAAHLTAQLARRLEPSLLKAGWWAFGRLGARVPVYGPLNTLVPTETVETWLEQIISAPPNHPEALFAAVQMSRRTGDRYRDIDEALRARVLAWLEAHDTPAAQIQLVREVGELEAAEEQQVFGESLPPGLHLSAE